MSLLSTLAAHDLGYLTTDALVERLDRTLTTLEGLERYDGHFLNWYDTATLAPLHPRYVSTVDSGNLAGALMALAQGLLELDERPQTRAQRLDGLVDTADAARHGVIVERRAIRTRGRSSTEINRLARAIAGGARDGGRRTPSATIADARDAARRRVSRRSIDGRTTTPPDDIAYWCRAVLDGRGERSTAEPHVPAEPLRDARRPRIARSPTACGSSSCTTGGAASSRSATGWPTPTVPDGSTAPSTTCWRRKRGSPASSRSPRATSRSTTGSISGAW